MIDTDPHPDTIPHGMLRDLSALLVVLIAVPVSVFGGANVGCVGSAEFSGSCALSVIVVSPLVLLASGAVGGILSRGWTGLLVVLVGTLLGMFTILLLSLVAGKPVPVDWFSAIVATVFFMGPVVIGYGVGRVATRFMGARR